MRTISLDLRERILTAYDRKEGNREEVARRFRVSVGLEHFNKNCSHNEQTNSWHFGV